MQQRPLPWIAATMLALVATVVAPLVTTTTAAADPGGVVISEVHYHAGSDLDTDDFLELEGDLELAPLSDSSAHLSLSATYDEPRHGLGRSTDNLRCRRTTEAVVRSFLASVASALEARVGPTARHV